MGLGDQLIATGMARGARARGRLIAFGDGRRIKWDHNSATVFQGNPNIAQPGSERRGRALEWVRYYKGHRIYNTHDVSRNRWIWNEDFRPVPGEMFLTDAEKQLAARVGSGFIVIEPNVETWKSSAANKDWGRSKYQEVADVLRRDHRVVQFTHPKSGPILRGVEAVPTHGFRDALGIMEHATLYVGPEGGLHHGAAAMGVPGVVLFGGFIPPSVTGYDTHTNLTGGAEACGSLSPCKHCKAAMAAISVDEVLEAAKERLTA
ncbi:MAG: glycosyltransferase family 9 protein [Minisyncoccia bacterium]